MRSPFTAITWEIWQRGRRFACLALGCVSFCALVNFAAPERFRSLSVIQGISWLLMVWSFLFVFGFFNYTEITSTREWNGFPYRLFTLPVPTWKLVTLPMLSGVVGVELIYVAWIKLVWTHEKIPSPEWFAVVLGAYMVFFLTALWSLAGFRITRLLVLSVGGTSSIAVACLPMFAEQFSTSWLKESHLIAIIIGLALVAFGIAWVTLARQRCGGGRRRNLIKTVADRIIDAFPRRTREFNSAAGAQFWFEWRQSGLLLPSCAAFTLIFIIGPISWAYRTDAHSTMNTLLKILGMPLVLAFAVGKGFVKPEFWSTNLAFPTFLAIRPLPAGEFVVTKMKVAALSVAITWLLALGFIALWLPCWADVTDIKQLLSELRMFYRLSWLPILLLYLVVFMVFTWRFMVNGLWLGLSGNRSYYVGSLCLQVIVPVLLMLAAGYWSDDIDRQIKEHPDQTASLALRALGWILAGAVIARLWLAIFSWRNIGAQRMGQHLLIWSCVTAGFIVLAVISSPPFDSYRLEHLYVLAALLLMPFARLGFAPASLAGNRHR